jgi:hypothetical protein
VLLFQKRFHDGLQNGAVTLTFRRWEKPRVKVGGRYRCHPIGVLEVDEISQVSIGQITEQDARSSGFGSRQDLLAYIEGGPGGTLDEDTRVYRVVLHHGGDGDRVPIALDAHLSEEDVKTLRKKIGRLDGDCPWTMQTLRIIEQHPQVAARILAKKLGRERDPFKVDVRKLKRLGLTQSFEIGYELSPRGRAFLAALAQGDLDH